MFCFKLERVIFMIMVYKWTNSLETGNENIDSQHKEIFYNINKFINAVYEGEGEQELEKIAAYLYKYTLQHFEDEENLFLKYNYPEYEEHKEIHGKFKGKVIDIVSDIIHQNKTEEIVQKLTDVLSTWLTNHIKLEDFKFVEYLKKIETIE